METYSICLGKTKVQIIKENGRGKTLVHLHENEVTALIAAKQFIAKQGGSLIRLHHNGARNIVFYLENVRYEFDPNRIFTKVGIKKTLQQLGPYSIEAHQEVAKLADTLKRLLPEDKVIAVHNNKEYSLESYFPHNPLADEVEAYYYLANSNPRNFYFVTQAEDYYRLKKFRFNVALQNPDATDDGSLSYYLSKKSYINIEAGYDQLNEQLKMIHRA